MGVDINWSLLRPVDVGGAFQAGREKGQRQGALAALARDPTNADALAGLAEVAPDDLYRFQAAQRQQSDWSRGARFRDALSAYQRRGPAAPNALTPSMSPPASDALAPFGSQRLPVPKRGEWNGPPLGNTLHDYVGGDASAPAPNALPVDSGDGPDIMVTGRRPAVVPPIAPMRAPGGAGWDDVIAADPVAAMDAGGKMYDDRKDMIEDWQHVSSRAMASLGGVRDQDSYDRARAQAQRQFEAFGLPFPELPDEYSPEAIHDIQIEHLKLEDQVHAALADKKFKWQQEDDLLDNRRADRNTDSQISDRNARRALTARGQNLTDARGRYGISVASSDRRRGQDLAAARPRSGKASAGKLTRIAVGPDGKKIGWDGKAWVPAQ